MLAPLTALLLALAAQTADERYGNPGNDPATGADAAEGTTADETTQDNAAADDGIDGTAGTDNAGTEAAAESMGDVAADAQAAAAAAFAETPPVASQIVIATETPQPTLAETEPAVAAPPAGETAAPAQTPAVADPADVAAPLRGAGATADQLAAQAAATATAEESSVLVNTPKPADLMRSLLHPPAAGLLAGTPISLGQAMRGAATRPAQTDRAKAYWSLSAAVAHYYLAVQEQTELAALQQGVNVPGAPWGQAKQDAAARVDQARRFAEAAQFQLARVMGVAVGSPLPLPADAPHCGRYNTRYDEIFAGRQDPVARQVNELLPQLYAELAAETRQVAESLDWLAFVVEKRDPATDGVGVLRAYELMTVRRRAFIDAARNYNDQIALYAELATPEQVAPERLVAMLIRVSNPGTPTSGAGTAAADGGVQPASATEDAASESATGASTPGAASTGRGGRRTFAERKNFEARRPFSRFRSRERSIVVRRGLLRGLLDGE
jgi:hypothetical protein